VVGKPRGYLRYLAKAVRETGWPFFIEWDESEEQKKPTPVGGGFFCGVEKFYHEPTRTKSEGRGEGKFAVRANPSLFAPSFVWFVVIIR